VDLSQLAQLGEFIGGIGVFATLIYLAIQMRQSNAMQNTAAELARAEANENASRGWSTWRQMLTDSELSSIWRKAHESEELSPDERVRLHYVMAELTYASLTANSRFLAAGSSEYDGVPQAVLAREIGTSTTMREAWAEMSEELTAYGLQQFESEVTNLLQPRE